MFSGGKILITGGTGSFGNAVLQKMLDSDASEVRILSRDEKKQDDMRKDYSSDKLKFYLGDVRDREAVDNAVRGVDFIFHAAALKQVPSCEFFPLEAMKTNVIGTNNVLTKAIEFSVSKIVCLSTDKAVYPINAMGMTKALMEKVVVSASRNLEQSKTKICATRYGNVMSSRGSVIPLFKQQIESGAPITITNPNMTRFMMSLTDAVDLVMYAFENGNNGDLFIQKAPAATVQTIAKSVASLMGKEQYPVQTIGIRHGEKMHEVLMSKEELAVAEDMLTYFRIPKDGRDLNYAKYVEGDAGDRLNSWENLEDFNSANAERLDVEGLIEKLKHATIF